MREKLDEFDAMRQGSSGGSEAGNAGGPVDSFKANTPNTEKPPPVEKAVKKKPKRGTPEDNYSWD